MTPKPIVLTEDERDDAADAAFCRVEKRGGVEQTEQRICCAELVIAKITGYPWRILDDYPNECISLLLGPPPQWTVGQDGYTAARPYVAAHVVDWSVTLYGWAFGFEFEVEEKCYSIKEEKLARSESLCNWCKSMGRPWVPNKELEIVGM